MKSTVSSEKIHRAVRNILRGVSAASLVAATAPALAQTAAATAAASSELQEVVITGIRASLEKSMEVKKNAAGVVDAISAEDIGKFPDSNLAAAIQRVPGVSVSRGTSSMGGVPTTTGDATEITVRGFGPSFNQTLFDGRPVATAIGNTTRGFDFSSVGADFVNQVDIMKTPDSTMSSGAIGATINIKFPKPFDHTGMHLAVTASAAYAEDEKKTTPNGGILFSDTFADDTFGVLVDAVYSDHKVRGNHVNSQGWEGTQFAPSQFAGAAPGASTTPNTVGWFIQDYGIYQEHTEDKRVDGRAVLQWRPSSNIQLTVNDDYSKDTLSQQQYGYSVWFNAGALTNIVQNANGTLTSFEQNNTPTDFQSQVNGSVIENNLAGLNVKWDATEHQTFEFDASNSVAKLNPGGELTSIDVDVGYGPSGPGGTCNAAQPLCNGTTMGIAGVGSGSLPYPTGIGPNGNAALFINNGLIGSHVLPMSSQQNKDTINQFKLQGMWKDDASKLVVKYGLQYTDDTQNLSEIDSFQNNDWQAYAGYGPASHNTGGVALPQEWFTNSFSTGSFINGFSNNGKLPPNVLVFNPYQVLNYLQGLGNPQTTNIPGANTNCCNPPFNGIYSMVPNVGATQRIEEKTFSPYVNLQTQVRIAEMPLDVNIGLRDEHTQLTSEGLGQLPTSLTVQASDHTAFLVTYTGTTTIKNSSSYRYLLPNIDLGLWVTDQVKVRLDASRTLTRPPLNYITPVLNVPQGQRVGALVATGGNPGLLPFTSDNLDIGAEWYYGSNSYASIDFFLKNVTNFIIGGTTQQTINDVIDPTTGKPGVFSVTSRINGPSAEVRGVELAIQQMLGDTGFGFEANATFVSSDKKYDPYNISVSEFAVTGLANSANLVAFYDKHGFQARIAVNWRDEYLDHFGQQQNNSAFGQEPTFVNSNTQVDFSTSYDFLTHYGVYFEALNLNDSTYSTHGRFKEQVLDVIDFGRRYTLGVRAKF